ncbi:MAG: mechanosensitive ion channel [Psychrobacter sp.]|nr:mechanosensitive ion channel [Psychrobacter sp.]
MTVTKNKTQRYEIQSQLAEGKGDDYLQGLSVSPSLVKGRTVANWRMKGWLALALSLALSLTLTLMASHSHGAETSEATVSSSLGLNQSENTPVTDAFGRDTPRHTVQGFIKALGDNDAMLASNYLNLTKSDNPSTVVRQFKQALDAGGRFEPDLQINNTPEGEMGDQLPPNQEKVGSISVSEKSVSLILERVTNRKGDQYWQFSRDTIKAIPDVIKHAEPTLVERYTITSLKGKKFFGIDLADISAVLILTFTTFMLTYIVVWLLYHVINFIYPRVRNKPLPLTTNVILPLAVVIMALILSEIMVSAGVSVTVRAPVNRLTDIASWVALTWLLLRVIDAVFNRAEHLSYKKNYTERVSILGLLRKLAKALLLIFATIVIFGNLGFDLTTGIAALGVGGLALALGAQKTIENLVGSVVVVADSPVRVGDYCKFGTYEGTVIDIGIRSTRVRTLNRTVVTIPNGDFSSMQIENFTSRDMFRFFHHLYIKRSADIEEIFKLVNHLDEFLDHHDLTNQERNQVYISELRQDCYVIELQAYVTAKDVAEFYRKQNVLFMQVLQQVEQFKVEQALPTQQLVVNQQQTSGHEGSHRLNKLSSSSDAKDNKLSEDSLTKDNSSKDPLSEERLATERLAKK